MNNFSTSLHPVSSHLFDSAQDLADLKDLIHLTVPGEKRPESVEFSHDAADSPQVNGTAVGRRAEQDLRSSVPGRWTQPNQAADQRIPYSFIKQRIFQFSYVEWLNTLFVFYTPNAGQSSHHLVDT